MSKTLRKFAAISLIVVGLYVVVDWYLTPSRHLPWHKDETAAFQTARSTGKGVMIDFSAVWCEPCQQLETTFADENVYRAIEENFVPLKFDVSEGTDEDERIQKKYDVGELPAVLFLTAEDRELGRVTEYLDPDDFAAAMTNAMEGSGQIGADTRFDSALQRGWLWAYLLAFAFGFLTSLTPCVYPMIPITVAVFGAKKATTKKRSFLLATAYVVGMGLLYAILGTVFALVGGRSGALLSNPWVIVPVAVFMGLLAISLFGAFEIRLPYALQNRLNQVGGEGYGGAFAMGLVGGLVAAPCTGPFLAGMLGFVATTGNWLAGSTLLFTYALGVGVLFWALALGSMSMPKSGPWMDGVKTVGGVALAVVALYFLRPVVAPLRGLAAPTTTTLIVAISLIVGGLMLALWRTRKQT